MGRLMAIDWGLARIGVALSDPTRTLASPLTVLNEKDKRAQVERVVALAREHEVDALVVGIPYELDGSVGPMAQQAGKYADKLAQVSGLPVIRLDESLTSVQAEELIADTGRGGRRRARDPRRMRGRVDKVAAAILLQDYLDGHASPREEDGGG